MSSYERSTDGLLCSLVLPGSIPVQTSTGGKVGIRNCKFAKVSERIQPNTEAESMFRSVSSRSLHEPSSILHSPRSIGVDCVKGPGRCIRPNIASEVELRLASARLEDLEVARRAVVARVAPHGRVRLLAPLERGRRHGRGAAEWDCGKEKSWDCGEEGEELHGYGEMRER